jgi:pimeloyl-ACP methyl ester carboxylesterase
MKGGSSSEHRATAINGAGADFGAPYAFYVEGHNTPDPELDYDPAADYQRIHCPVLLQYGANDLNVPVPESENRIRSALERAGNRDVTICI